MMEGDRRNEDQQRRAEQGGDDQQRRAEQGGDDQQRRAEEGGNNEAVPLMADPNPSPNDNAPSPDSSVVTSTTAEEQAANAEPSDQLIGYSEATPPSSVEPQPYENEDPIDDPLETQYVTSTTGMGYLMSDTRLSDRDSATNYLAGLSVQEFLILLEENPGGWMGDPPTLNQEVNNIALQFITSPPRSPERASTSRDNFGESPIYPFTYSPWGPLRLNPAAFSQRELRRVRSVIFGFEPPQRVVPDAAGSEASQRLIPAGSVAPQRLISAASGSKAPQRLMPIAAGSEAPQRLMPIAAGSEAPQRLMPIASGSEASQCLMPTAAGSEDDVLSPPKKPRMTPKTSNETQSLKKDESENGDDAVNINSKSKSSPGKKQKDSNDDNK